MEGAQKSLVGNLTKTWRGEVEATTRLIELKRDNNCTFAQLRNASLFTFTNLYILIVHGILFSQFLNA